MNTRNSNAKCGLTFPEVMVAMLILSIVVLGVIAFRYHSAANAWNSEVKIIGMRLGSMLLESWKGGGGGAAYDPETEFSGNLAVSAVKSGPDVPTGFTELGRYKFSIGDADYFATMSYLDATSTEPETLNVHVAWVHQGESWDADAAEDVTQLTTYTTSY